MSGEEAEMEGSELVPSLQQQRTGWGGLKGNVLFQKMFC